LRRGRGLRFVGPACSVGGRTPGDTTRKRNSDENYARRIDPLRMRARCSRRWTGMPYNRKHERATCLLRCGDSSENSKAGSHRKRRVAAALQRPLHRGRRPNHRQAKGYLPRLLKIDAFRPCPGVAAGPLSRDRRVAALLGAVAGTSPVALAEPDLESRASTDPPLTALPSANDPNVWSGRALQSVLNSK
jgi:hypothetical protein